jgi:adenylate cyclase class 2
MMLESAGSMTLETVRPMTLEVEQKFRVSDLKPIRLRLDSLGARWLPALDQCDSYFAHPQRNFAVTDEALRLRRTHSTLALTYKGPRTDRALKTRRETEVALPVEAAAGLTEILLALGFRHVAQVKKRRTEAAIAWQSQHAHVALDEVADAGTFVEIEVIVPAGPTDVAAQAVASLAEFLSLSLVEPRTYLELVLQTLAPQEASAKS